MLRLALAQPLEIALGDEAFDIAMADVELAVFSEGDGSGISVSCLRLTAIGKQCFIPGATLCLSRGS